MRAVAFGAEIAQPGYNIFVFGTARQRQESSVSRALERMASQMPTPPDWCYVQISVRHIVRLRCAFRRDRARCSNASWASSSTRSRSRCRSSSKAKNIAGVEAPSKTSTVRNVTARWNSPPQSRDAGPDARRAQRGRLRFRAAARRPDIVRRRISQHAEVRSRRGFRSARASLRAELDKAMETLRGDARKDDRKTPRARPRAGRRRSPPADAAARAMLIKSNAEATRISKPCSRT